jgi:hypothetical protein
MIHASQILPQSQYGTQKSKYQVITKIWSINILICRINPSFSHFSAPTSWRADHIDRLSNFCLAMLNLNQYCMMDIRYL